MNDKLKFLNDGVAESAVSFVVDALGKHPFNQLMPDPTFSIAVLVPASHDAPDESHILMERNVGGENWQFDYAQRARGLAKQIWKGRQDGCNGVPAHLLFGKGDVCIGGGVKRLGIVVACYGVPLHFACMISGMVADLCIAFAYDNYARWLEDERANGRNPAVT